MVSDLETPEEAREILARIQDQPKELGYLLLAAGTLGLVLPGPGMPALVAGGIILWPKRFRKVEGWFRKQFPTIHEAGIVQVERYLTDLESRYPGSTSEGEPEGSTTCPGGSADGAESPGERPDPAAGSGKTPESGAESYRH